MRVSIANDEAGRKYAELLKKEILSKGFKLVPLTPQDTFVDYPDAANILARSILDGKTDKGVLICGSGVGVSVAANKFPGIRAAVCHDGYSAHQGVEHDQMNVLCLGARVIGEELAKELVGIFLSAQPSSEERHLRRMQKINLIEIQHLKKTETNGTA